MKLILTFLIISFSIISCKNESKEPHIETYKKTKKEETVTPKKQRPIAFNNGKFFTQKGNRMLYGGKDSLQHFNINNSELIEQQFHYGIGREKFPALLKPQFTSIENVDSIWSNDDRFLIAKDRDDIKAYSIKDLTRHEIVNDELNGKPIMAAYCILADLGAVYDRIFGDHTLTFALSGYTYYDNTIWKGVDGFVLWDRETESLWWPLVEKAVAGPLKDVKLQELDKIYWEDTNWKKIKEQYPTAKILASGQDFERPKHWTKIEDVSNITNSYK